jgi:hypothetical protein
MVIRVAVVKDPTDRECQGKLRILVPSGRGCHHRRGELIPFSAHPEPANVATDKKSLIGRWNCSYCCAKRARG